jgi:hypothetical protein
MSPFSGVLSSFIASYKVYDEQRVKLFGMIADSNDPSYQQEIQVVLEVTINQMGNVRNMITNHDETTCRAYYTFDGTWDEFMEHIGDMV